MKPEIIYLPLSEIKPYENNPRYNESAVDAVAQSIKEFGFKNPIIVDKHKVIIAGHTRYKASQQLGLEEVPCIIASDLTDQQAKAYRLVDNKVGELAEWDFLKLGKEITGLPEYDFEGFGFDLQEIEDKLDLEKELVDDEYEIPETIETRVKKGEVWQLGRHRLMCGDSTDKATVEKLMNGNNADMVFTDPPYNVAFNGRSGKFDVIENDDMPEADFDRFIASVCEIIKHLAPTHYYIWCNWKFYSTLQTKMEFKSCIVWAKNVFGLGKGYRHQHEFCLFNGEVDESIKNESDLWEIAKDTNYVHPTQKPVELCGRALKNHSCARNVVDLFGGSGSTLIACEQLNRQCYTMELDEKYASVIVDRWEKFTGKVATKIC